MRQHSHSTLRNFRLIAGLLLSLGFLTEKAEAQMYYADDYYRDQYYRDAYQNRASAGQPPPSPRRNNRRQQDPYAGQNPMGNLQYDQRDAEMILRDQLARANQYPQVDPREQQYPYANQYPQADPREQQPAYNNYYDHRISDETQVERVMADARHIGNCLRNKNGKASIVIDKRNFQFYLYDRDGRLLRIGPVAIGKGKTEVGAFETPVGIFPIKDKVAVADWVRPDWYFIEEGEPVPKKWEDRRVPGFFRYKLVFDGSRYIHYAEATGGRLTHGCLGLDWQDAEAVFHTMEVGSYCIVADQSLLSRLARGEFPVKKQTVAKPAKPDEAPATVTAKADEGSGPGSTDLSKAAIPEKAFRDLW
jgi:lipoprotein-anchoring transpeptidase ErfK/SrfK